LDTEKVPTHRLVAFSAPAFITSLMYGPLVGILPTIYAKYFALDLALIGTVLVISRFFDAVTDPVIGYLSDHTKTRIGRRKPWMLAGYGLTLFALYALFVPPENVSGTYFMVNFILFYLFMTMAEIPYAAWQVELSNDYRQRTRIVTYRNVSLNLGLALFSAIPLLPVFATSEFTPEVFHMMAWIAIILLPPAVLVAIFLVPEGKQISVRETATLSELFASLSKNKAFLHLIASFILFGFGGSVYSAAAFMYFDTYLLMGDMYPIIMLASLLAGLLAMPFWLKMMNQFGRHRAWSVGAFLGVFLLPLFLLFEPNSEGFGVLLLVCMIINANFVLGTVAPMAMLGDVIDYDILKSGASRAGQYYALLTLVQKGIGALGSGF